MPMCGKDDQTVEVRINRISHYDVSPQQIFLPRESSNSIKVKIKTIQESELHDVTLDGNSLPRSDWSLELNSDGSGILAISQATTRELTSGPDKSGGQRQHLLKLDCERGFTSIPILIF